MASPEELQPVRPDGPVGGSFRDPSGFVFRRDGIVYRQVNEGSGTDALGQLEASGLYEELTSAGLLVSHEAVDVPPQSPERAHCVIRPEQVPFLSGAGWSSVWL